jgi:hypothetical protein
VNNPAANKLGWLSNGYAVVYEPYGVAPWQDDFFTWSIGYLVNLGFDEASAFLLWKLNFVLGRMMGDGYCWLNASTYSLQVGLSIDNEFQTFAELHSANFGASQCIGGEMRGYPDSPTGYGANMQPALAIAVDANKTVAAWNLYQSRSPKQVYTSDPQFAVFPRLLEDGVPTSVDLLALSAKVERGWVVLTWRTTNATNCLGFEVQRNGGAAEFHPIGFIKNLETQHGRGNFTFMDSTAKDEREYVYRLRKINLDGTSEYSQTVRIRIHGPLINELVGNYPNPFNPITNIVFSLAKGSLITLKLYDTQGRLVRVLIDNEYKAAGHHSLSFNAAALTSGEYFYILSNSTGWSQSGKLLLLK